MKIWVDDVRPAPDGYIWCKNERWLMLADFIECMKEDVNVH